MDSSAVGFFALLFAIGAFALLAVVIAMAAGAAMLAIGILMLVKRRQRMQLLQKAENCFICTAAVADARLLHRNVPKKGLQNEYQFALHFSGADGMQHRAFLAIVTPLVMNLAVGQTVPITVFSVPQVEPSAAALDLYRGMDGRLPESVEARTWLDHPIDETGTVMLADDHQRAIQTAQQKNRNAVIFGSILLGITALRVLYILFMFVTGYM